MAGKNLESADLSDANLTGANLDDTNLSDAKLHDAYLHSTNLTGAIGADFTNVKFDNTTMPDGSIRTD